MAYIFLTDLDVALANAGIDYVEINEHGADATNSSTWRERGRPASTGGFAPEGVLCHHTASPPGTSDEAELNVILAGNGSAPGPISSLFLGRTGVCYIVAAGRCNHGGKGRRPGVDVSACADMNYALLGIEAGNSGVGEYWSDALTETYGRVVAALCAHYGWDVHGDVYLHNTTGPPTQECNSKIDPSGPWQQQPDLPGGATWNLETWRAWCSKFDPSDPLPIPPKPPSGGIVPKIIIHVDESQPQGSDGYYRFNAVWSWVGAWRYHLPSELGVQQAVYEFTGDPEVFSHPLGSIIRNPAWVQPVGALDGYGAVAGHDPGDV